MILLVYVPDGCFCSIQDVFGERVKIHKHWKDAEATLTKKREAKVKLELANKQEKLAQAKTDCEEVTY